MNEMPQRDYADRVRRIQLLLDRFPAAPVAVTCRAADYVEALRLQKLEILPLDKKRQREYLHRYLGEAEGDALFWQLAGGKDAAALWHTWQSAGGSWDEFWQADKMPEDVYKETTAAQDALWAKLRSGAQSSLLVLAANPYLLAMLSRLYRPWSMLRAVRQFRRHRAAGSSKVCAGFEGIHFQLSRTEFQQPDNAQAYSRQDFDRLFAFRHTLDPTQMLEVRQMQLGLGADTWQVIDQCANGFRLLRTLAGRRIEPGQLVSICPHDGKTYLLAQVAWLMQEQTGGLIAGIAALPGKPLAVAARPLLRDAGDEGRYQRAFILPAVPAIAAEQTLILPVCWFRAERVMEVFGETLMHVKLQRRMSEGRDFQPVTFTVV